MKNIDLIDKEQVSIATLTNETEHVEATLMPMVEDYESITLSQQKKAKEALGNLKKRVMLSLDKRKLGEAQKLFAAAENISELFSDIEIMERVKENTKSAMDLKFLAESYAKIIDSQQKLMRLDSIDGQGNAAKLSLAIKFNGSDGSNVQTYIQAEG